MNEYEKMFHDIVMDSDAQCPSDIKASIDYVLNKIKEEPRSILILRYGLYGNEPCTYKQIAQKRGISFDAARNRYAKAMRIVRYPKNYIFIKYGMQAAEKILEERNREPNAEQKDSFEEFCMRDIKDAFSFSVRTYNALKRGGINTVEQLINHNDDELLKIRNLGRKSVNETIDAIKNALEKFNLSREEYLKSLNKD